MIVRKRLGLLEHMTKEFDGFEVNVTKLVYTTTSN